VLDGGTVAVEEMGRGDGEGEEVGEEEERGDSVAAASEHTIYQFL